MVFLLMCYQPLNVLSYFSSSLKIERYPVIVWQKKKNNVLVLRPKGSNIMRQAGVLFLDLQRGITHFYILT